MNSICDFGIPGKSQIWKNGVFASDFCLKLGKMLWNFLNIANNFWRVHIVKITSSWMVFPSPKMVWPLLKLPNAEDSHYSKIDENVDKVKQLVLKTRRLILHEVDNMLGIQFFSVQSSLKENLNMYWIATQCVSLSGEQKNCVSMCQDLQETSEIDLKLLSNIITGGQTLVYVYSPESNKEFSQWESISMWSILKTRVLKLDCESIFIPIPTSSIHRVVNCDCSIRRNCKPVFQWHYMASVEERAGKWLEMWIMGLVSVQWHWTRTLFLPHAHMWIAAVTHLYTSAIASCHLSLPKTYSDITY